MVSVLTLDCGQCVDVGLTLANFGRFCVVDVIINFGRMSQIFEHDSLVRHWHQKADFEVRKAKRPDYYALLMVSASLISWRQTCNL